MTTGSPKNQIAGFNDYFLTLQQQVKLKGGAGMYIDPNG